MPRALVALLAACLAAGCTTGQHGLYDWGEFDAGQSAELIDHDPNAALAIYAQTLEQIQQRNGRVPPGLHADYGFLLYLRGDYAGALRGFEAEKRLFPESIPLMDTLIARVRQRQGDDTPTTGVPAPTPPYSSTDSQAPQVGAP
jgi:hypothetical protein